jgi:hypothetical protein
VRQSPQSYPNWQIMCSQAALVVLLLSGSGAWASNTICSNADETLAYKSSVYAGGARPPPSMITQTQSVVYNGETLKNTFSSAAGWVRQFNTTFNTTAVALGTATDRSKNLVTSTTATGLSITQVDQTQRHEKTIPLHWDGWVICARSSPLMPPP